MQFDGKIGRHPVVQQGWLTRIQADGELSLSEAQGFCALYEKILLEQKAVYAVMLSPDSGGGATKEARRYMVDWQRQSPDTRQIFLALVTSSMIMRAAVTLIMSAMSLLEKNSGHTKFFPSERAALAWLDSRRQATER